MRPRRPRRRRFLFIVTVMMLSFASLGACGEESGVSVKVQGNVLVGADGAPVILRGVNRASGEYACIDGWGVFDGPVDATSIDAMKSWNINVVRIPLNSACWLDLEKQFAKYNKDFAGAAYQEAVADYVDLLTANGLYVILELHWTGCGDAGCLANWLKPMPDRPYAASFWGSVAERFKDNHAVMFDLFNEPNGVDWECWRNGGCTQQVADQEYTSAGMQEMVDAVRDAGATSQPVLLGGLQYANDMSGWLEHLPADPSNSLVASIHLYNFNWPCPTSVDNQRTAEAAIECFSSSGVNPIDAIAAAHPIVFGELGQDGCATDFVSPMLEWIAQRGFGVLGWAWNTADCATFPALISNYDGTPTAYGEAFRRFYTGTGAAASPTALDSPGATSTQILSRGRPAFVSTQTEPMPDASDDSYTTSWQLEPGKEGWLAYDLSEVPVNERGEIVVAWYTQLDDGFSTERIRGSCPVWEGRPFLGDYLVEVNAAPGGQGPPRSGWREVAAVQGNRRLSGQHLIDLQEANWIRIRGSGPNGVQVNVDVAAAAEGNSGGWLFMGDSITAAYAGHNPLNGPSGTSVPGIMALVDAGSNGEHQFLGQNNGVSCAYSSGALDWIDSMLDDFHGSFVTLNFGANDSWGGQGDPEEFYATLEQLVAKVEGRGLVAVVPTIAWPNDAGDWDMKVQAMNEQIRRLYAAHPSVIEGPDLYGLLKDKPEFFSSAGDPHPNEAGLATIRQAWAEAILGNVY